MSLRNQKEQADFYGLKLMTLNSGKKFTKEYEKYDEKSKRKFYLRVLTEIKASVVNASIDNLKRLSNVIENMNVKKYKLTTKDFFCDDGNPLKSTNLVIEACKHNQAGILLYLFTDDVTILKNLSVQSGRKILPCDEDGTGHNAFYYAIRSSNVELLHTLMKWPENFFDTRLEELDRIISVSYEELKLKNVLLSEKMEFLVENELVNLRFYSRSSNEDQQTNQDNVKKRIELVLENIYLLMDDSTDSEVDERFLFITKCIAQNMHVLKRQLKVTYDRLPWEEIEFCLVCFISSRIKQQEINLFVDFTLDKKKLLHHLEVFATELEIAKRSVEEMGINDLAKLSNLSRSKVIEKIMNTNPQFEGLYADYQTIRDIHSLQKMNVQISLALSSDPGTREGQIIIMRVLQVIGEHLKNTLESPNLSDATSDLIILSIRRDTRKIIIDLRNSLSHAHSLFKRTEIERNSDSNFFKGIQNDIKSVHEVILDILLNKKTKIIRILLEKIISSQDLGEIKNVIEIFDNADLEDNMPENVETIQHQKLKNLLQELKGSMPIETNQQYIHILFQRLDHLIHFTDNSENIKFDYNLLFLRLKKLNIFKGRIVDHNVIRVMKFRAEKTLENMDPQMESKILNGSAELLIEILTSVKSQMNFNELNELARLVYYFLYIVEYKADNFKWIEELRENFYQNKSSDHTHDDIERCNLFESKQLELKNILNEHLLSGELTEKISLYKNNKQLQAVVEMLVLDLMSIMGSHKLKNNYLFLDDDYPVLTGKCLRNFLAHGNVLVTLLADPSMNILLNARKLTEGNIMKSKKKLGKLLKDDPSKQREKYKKSLEIITYQKRMFVALEEGNMKDLNDCLRNGTDVMARNVKSWTTLHFAAKGPKVEALKFALDQYSNANFKDVNGRSPLHIAAAFGRTDNVDYLVEEAGLCVDDLDNYEKSTVHVAAQNGHKHIVKLLMNYVDTTMNSNESPLYCAIQNNHLDVVEMLLEGNENVDIYETKGGFTPLHQAAESGHIEIVKLLIQKKAEINAKSDRDYTPLHAASLNGHLDVVNVLILKRAYINAKDVEGCSPLHYAVSNNHEEIVKVLLDHEAIVDACHKTEKYTPLHIASAHGFERIAEILLKYNANASKKTANGKAPLHFAVQNGHLKVAHLLLNYGVNLGDKGERGATALHYAVTRGYTKIAEILIEKGAEVDATDIHNYTPLYCAALRNHTDIVKLLTENKANVNVQETMCRNSVAHIAAMIGNRDVIDILTRNGADVKGKNKFDSTPLHEAAAYGYKEVVLFLIDKQAEVNARSKCGFTPLHVASMAGKKDVVDILIKNKAEVNAKCNFNCTSLHLAVDEGHLEVINILIANGANVNANRCINYPTPLLSAIKYNYKEIVDILIVNGADVNGENGEPLHLAVTLGYRVIVEKLIKENARINEEYISKATLLHIAAERGHKEIVNILIERGADVDAIADNNLTPLYFAAEEGHEDIVNILVENGADVFIKSHKGVAPLHRAAQKGYNKVVKILLKKETSCAIEDGNNPTPLELAVENGHLEVAKLFFESTKLNVSAKCKDDNTLLHIAAQGSNLEMVKFLVKYGYDINAKNSSGSKPIHIAAEKGFKEAIVFLLEMGSNINDINNNNESVLHFASSENRLEIITYLVNEGTNINLKNADGLTSLHIAAKFGYKDILEILLKNGAAYNVFDNNGKKPLNITKDESIKRYLAKIDELFKAVTENNFSEVKKCIITGVFVDVTNHERETPLHYACRNGFDKIVDILLENHASPNTVSSEGWTPLHYAVKFSHFKIVKNLLSYGAIINMVAKNGETPINLSTDKNISALLNLVSELFEVVKNSDLTIINKLKIIKEIDTMKAIMCACNERNQTLTVYAMRQNHLEAEQLKEVLQEGVSDLIKKAEEFRENNDYQKALDIFNDVLERRKSILGPYNPGTLEIERNIALTLYKRGSYREALNMFDEIFLKQKTILVFDNIDTLYTKSFVALVLHRLCRNEEAFDIYQEIYHKLKEISGSNHIISEILFNFALVLTEQGKYEEALDIYKAYFEKRRGVLGPYHQETLRAQNNIAMVLSNQGKNEEALKIYNEVLLKKEIVLGSDHIDTLRTLQSIAQIFSNQKKYHQAFQKHQEILAKQKRVLGHDHPETLRTKCNILTTLFDQGKYVGFLKVYNECIHQLKKLYGEDHPIIQRILSKIKVIRLRFKLDGYKVEEMLKQIQESIVNAVKDNEKEGVQRLIKRGADVNVKDNNGKSLLHYVVNNENIDIINMLLENGADVNAKDNDGSTPLHYAAIKGNIDIINMLWENAANVNVKDHDGRTPLHYAVSKGHNDIVDILLKYGAIVTQITDKGNTPLHIAVLNNNEKVVEGLLKHASSEKLMEFINVKTSSSGSTALHVASLKGFLKIVRILLKYGAIYNIENNICEKPLDLSTDRQIINILKQLEELFEYAKEGDEEIIKKMSEIKKDDFSVVVNARNNERHTILQVVIFNKHKNLAEKLVEMFKS